MNDQERYEDAVRRLLQYGYEVVPDGHCYSVRHQQDTTDISRAHTLNELIDLADLMQWAAQRNASLHPHQ